MGERPFPSGLYQPEQFFRKRRWQPPLGPRIKHSCPECISEARSLCRSPQGIQKQEMTKIEGAKGWRESRESDYAEGKRKIYQIRHGDGLCRHPILLFMRVPIPSTTLRVSRDGILSMGFRLITQGIAPRWVYRLWTQDNWYHFTGVLWSPNKKFFQLFLFFQPLQSFYHCLCNTESWVWRK